MFWDEADNQECAAFTEDMAELRTLRAELTRLREDKARLEFILDTESNFEAMAMYAQAKLGGLRGRAAIDQARKS
jgi:acyl-coenzyme A thioesterase PaaI-like protein